MPLTNDVLVGLALVNVEAFPLLLCPRTVRISFHVSGQAHDIHFEN